MKGHPVLTGDTDVRVTLTAGGAYADITRPAGWFRKERKWRVYSADGISWYYEDGQLLHMDYAHVAREDYRRAISWQRVESVVAQANGSDGAT